MTVTAKAAADVTQTYATLQAGDLFGVERAGVFGKTTFSELQAQDYTFSGTVDFTGTLEIGGVAVTATAAELNRLDGITALSGSDTVLITGTAGTDGNVAVWNADGDLVDGVDLAATYEPITTLGTQSTSTTVPIDFTSIPAGVNEINVMITELSLSGTDDLLVQIGDSGGIETTGYVSETQYATTQASSTAGFIIAAGNASASVSGCLTLRRVSGNKWVATGVFGRGQASAFSPCITAGVKTLSAELDRIRITRNGSNTIDANAGVNISYR